MTVAGESEVLRTVGLSLWYGRTRALEDISVSFARNKVTALIGPSGCGKSTLLRCLNRMNDINDECRIEGQVLFNGEDIYSPGTNVVELRKKIGMVFQKPNPFQKTIYENIAYGPRIHGLDSRKSLDDVVERCLKESALWEECDCRLDEHAYCLSGGQQQRLCIARALAVEPEIILMDEPCSALDPIAASKIEDLIQKLKRDYTVVIVTHNMQQAARVSDYTGFLYLGKLVEFGMTTQIFENPNEELTEKYVTGSFG